jgi:hypothetical protein
MTVAAVRLAAKARRTSICALALANAAFIGRHIESGQRTPLPRSIRLLALVVLCDEGSLLTTGCASVQRIHHRLPRSDPPVQWRDAISIFLHAVPNPLDGGDWLAMRRNLVNRENLRTSSPLTSCPTDRVRRYPPLSSQPSRTRPLSPISNLQSPACRPRTGQCMPCDR